MLDHRLTIRVRYHEVDGQGRVHHAQYLNYFERGRVEMLRDWGHSYKDLEATGLMLVVRRMEIEYVIPAEFDDELIIETTVLKSRGARIEHRYQVTRSSDQQLIVTAKSEIACVDRSGAVRRLPSYLQSTEK
ncbi:MAG: thioesterase family protein [Pirellulaceae bacterium]|nr:thioesterase family protein [Pirellulaceae bacterium]